MSKSSAIAYQFNAQRSILFVKCILASLAVVTAAILIGANDIAIAKQQEQRREFRIVTVEYPNGSVDSGSIILFPGTEGVSVMIDFMFFVGVPAVILIFGTILYVTSSETTWSSKWRTDVHQLSRYWFILLTFGAPMLVLLLHASGNAHYQVWCASGVIPSDNCFWLFDYRSFLAGCAGFIAFSALFPLFYGIATVLLYVMSCRICFDRTTTTTVESKANP